MGTSAGRPVCPINPRARYAFPQVRGRWPAIGMVDRDGSPATIRLEAAPSSRTSRPLCLPIPRLRLAAPRSWSLVLNEGAMEATAMAQLKLFLDP